MKFVTSIIVSCNCHILFELFRKSGPCTPILSTVFLSLAVGQIEHLPWAQNSPVGFEKKCHRLKAIYVPNDDYFVSVELQ